MKTIQPSEESQQDKDNIAIANCLLFPSSSCSSSTSFAHYTLPMLLFSKPPTTINNSKKLNLEKQVSEAAVGFIRHIVASAADNCHKFFSLPPDFSMIHQRNHRNVRFVSNHNFAAILPGDSVAGVVVANGILNFLNIYNTLLVVRLVLTWFPSAPPAIVSPLSTLCDPYLNIFRGIIPPLGGSLDLSPILAFLVLNVFTSTASALPAELPSTVNSQNQFPISSSKLTSSHQKWTRRLFQQKTNNSSDNK